MFLIKYIQFKNFDDGEIWWDMVRYISSVDTYGVYETGIKVGTKAYDDRMVKTVTFTGDGGAKNGIAALMKAEMGNHITELHCWAHNNDVVWCN